MPRFHLHKIRNIPRDVCTAEQKIAYNLAFRCHISYQEEYNRVKKDGTAAALSAGVYEMIARIIRDYQAAYTFTPGKYDLDAIHHALHVGLKSYMDNPQIYTTFAEIGEAFPILYT